MTGTLEELRLLTSVLKASGYKQMLYPCVVQGSSASGTDLRCPYDFHTIRSDEIGLGPYSGSYFDLTVRDGKIVRASDHFNSEEFGGDMWSPFYTWVLTTYPNDLPAMYSTNGLELSEESIALWEKRTREYVEEVRSDGVETTP